MEDGRSGELINPWAVALFRTLQLTRPSGATQEAAYGKWLDQTPDREEARRDRLHGAEGIIPGTIWIVLILIACVVFTFMLFFADSGEARVSQAMLKGSATTVIALTLLAINALDNPYRVGLGHISPVAMERSLRTLDKARAVTGDTATPPLRRPRRRGLRMKDQQFGLAATVLLPVAAVATAWAAYQSARWHGEQARGQSASIAARVESARSAGLASRNTQVDLALFTQWIDAYARKETELAAFYSKRFREEFQPAFRAWVATKPRINPDAPLSPFAMPEYSSRRPRKRDALEAKAAAASLKVGVDIQRADNYSLAVVLFAAALFFAGISTRLVGTTPRMFVLGLGYTLFLGSLIWIATFPVSVSV